MVGYLITVFWCDDCQLMIVHSHFSETAKQLVQQWALVLLKLHFAEVVEHCALATLYLSSVANWMFDINPDSILLLEFPRVPPLQSASHIQVKQLVACKQAMSWRKKSVNPETHHLREKPFILSTQYNNSLLPCSVHIFKCSYNNSFANVANIVFHLPTIEV